MKKWVLSLTMLIGIVGLSACNNSDNSEAVVETKAGNITKDELYEAMKDKYGNEVIQELVYLKILSDKYGVTDEEVEAEVNEVKEQYGEQFELVLLQNQLTEEKFRQNVKLNLAVEKASIVDIEVTDEELQDYYDNLKMKIKARHILIKDEAVAKDVLAQLKAGGDFAALAKEHSEDPGSGSEGGELGWFGPGKMLPEFEEAAYALDVNEISELVQTDYGYHIIQLLEKEEKPSIEDMKAEIEYDVKVSKIDGTVMNNALQRELKEANVKMKDSELTNLIQEDSTEK